MIEDIGRHVGSAFGTDVKDNDTQSKSHKGEKEQVLSHEVEEVVPVRKKQKGSRAV